ncbi:MAG: RagB/SusD family nutrient uptake outer membrane protein [Mucilaginibacter sp.]
MKSYKKYIAGLTFVSCIIGTSCKKDFFNQPPQDQITLASFYKTADQVNASTNGLYNNVWFSWNNKASWAITELSGGNARTYSSDVVNFFNFSATADNTEVNNAWTSLFTVVAQSNALIYNLPKQVPASVPTAVVNNALGEAHFMRATAYFYLVRLFGNLPIIENTLDFVDNYQVNTNPVTDVYKFMINDLKFAEANCNTKANKITGHVSGGSASAMLSKVYLYMQDYTNARAEAEKVINSGEFKLLGVDVAGKTYTDLFEAANNNNDESIAALQWAGGASYGHGNSMQASFAINSIITGTGDGYSVIGPTIDLQKAYEPGDSRLHGTIMLAGDKYPELNKAAGGFTVPNDVNSQNTKAGIKKYVTGTPADNGGQGGAQSADNNTYLMRYAEVLLIEAEAVLGSAASTTDAAALAPFNKIRRRAGLNALATITRNDIMHERRIELAIEGDYWFDLGRMDGFNTTSHPLAKAIIGNQERGTYSNDNPPVIYTEKYTINDNQFLFPYPTSEVAANPKLKQPPVAYVFK